MTRTPTSTSTRTTLATVAVGALLVLVTACGSDDASSSRGDHASEQTEGSSDPGASSPPPSGGSDSSGQQPGDSQAVRVSIRTTGGLRGVDESATYAAEAPPPSGSSRAEVRRILAAASDPALRGADLAQFPKNPCCDLQQYTVLVTYADGSTETFRSVDGLQQPKVFEDLLGML